MSESKVIGKPTAGPWYAWENDGLRGVGKSHSNEADILRAVRERNRPPEEDAANMTLCASAPDLRDALIRARDDLNNAAFLIRKKLGEHHWLYGIEKGKKIADEAIARSQGLPPMTSENLAPRNSDGESVERTQMFRPRKYLIVKVWNAGDDDEPFICAVNGEVTVDALAQIEEELKGEHEFRSGPGEYVYYACYDQGEKDEFGNVHFAPFWELTEVAFEKPDWMSMSHEPEKHVTPTGEPCTDCGSASCSYKHNCFPF